MVKKNEGVFHDMGNKFAEMQNYIQQGCKTHNECTQLLAYLIDYREDIFYDELIGNISNVFIINDKNNNNINQEKYQNIFDDNKTITK